MLHPTFCCCMRSPTHTLNIWIITHLNHIEERSRLHMFIRQCSLTSKHSLQYIVNMVKCLIPFIRESRSCPDFLGDLKYSLTLFRDASVMDRNFWDTVLMMNTQRFTGKPHLPRDPFQLVFCGTMRFFQCDLLSSPLSTELLHCKWVHELGQDASK
jgi:hypothetical protein